MTNSVLVPHYFRKWLGETKCSHFSIVFNALFSMNHGATVCPEFGAGNSIPEQLTDQYSHGIRKYIQICVRGPSFLIAYPHYGTSLPMSPKGKLFLSSGQNLRLSVVILELNLFLIPYTRHFMENKPNIALLKPWNVLEYTSNLGSLSPTSRIYCLGEQSYWLQCFSEPMTSAANKAEWCRQMKRRLFNSELGYCVRRK